MVGNDNEKPIGDRIKPLFHKQIDLPGDVGRLHVDMQYERKAEDHLKIETSRTRIREYGYPQVEEIRSTTWRHHKINLLALVDKALGDAGTTSTSQCLRDMREALKKVPNASKLQMLLTHWKPDEEALLLSLLSSYKLSPYKHAGTVTWLHLSDLHCKGKRGKDDYDRSTVLDELWKDIEERGHRIGQDLEELNFICMTGDLVYHGIEEEYQFITTRVLPKLFAATGLDENRFFVVPGNHDICQKKVTEAAIGAKEKLLRDSKSRSTAIANALTKAEEREVYFRRLEAYREFFQYTFDHIELDEEGYFYVQPFLLSSGVTIAVLGLNSAWLSYGGESDRHQLVLGEYQVKRAIDKAGKACADLLIALNHHPFEWLADNHDRQQARLLLQRHCHFILQGHRHRNKAYREDTLLYILAGASYEDRYSPTLNSYNFVRLNLDKGEGRIYFRRYSDQKREWVSDNDVPGTDDGIKSFTLDR